MRYCISAYARVIAKVSTILFIYFRLKNKINKKHNKYILSIIENKINLTIYYKGDIITIYFIRIRKYWTFFFCNDLIIEIEPTI